MNDPNGLIWFNDRYHAFYQITRWANTGGQCTGDMPPATIDPLAAWAYCASARRREWQRRCFSGSAVDDNGVLSLIYTGTSGSMVQVMTMQFAKYNVWLQSGWYSFRETGCDPHSTRRLMHFRDPKVWREADTWWMVVGRKTQATRGRSCFIAAVHYVMDFRSRTGPRWCGWKLYVGSPDFFSLGDQHYLMFSPQGMMPRDTVTEIAFKVA